MQFELRTRGHTHFVALKRIRDGFSTRMIPCYLLADNVNSKPVLQIT